MAGADTDHHPSVLLLKSPKDDGKDPYEQVLERFHVMFLPVLSFDFLNIEEYSGMLSSLWEFSALVFTSQQAVKATQQALELLKGRKLPKEQIMCYVVGKSTGEQAKLLGFTTKGDDCGNAEKLADRIIEDMVPTDKPILFPCGNLKKDTLHQKLKSKGFLLKEITVYQTIKKDMKKEVQQLIDSKGYPDFAVFFSPSGVQALSPLFKEDWFSQDKVKWIAIGSSTEQEMEKHGLYTFGVCTKPDPASLYNVLTKEATVG